MADSNQTAAPPSAAAPADIAAPIWGFVAAAFEEMDRSVDLWLAHATAQVNENARLGRQLRGEALSAARSVATTFAQAASAHPAPAAAPSFAEWTRMFNRGAA